MTRNGRSASKYSGRLLTRAGVAAAPTVHHQPLRSPSLATVARRLIAGGHSAPRASALTATSPRRLLEEFAEIQHFFAPIHTPRAPLNSTVTPPSVQFRLPLNSPLEFRTMRSAETVRFVCGTSHRGPLRQRCRHAPRRADHVNTPDLRHEQDADAIYIALNTILLSLRAPTVRLHASRQVHFPCPPTPR